MPIPTPVASDPELPARVSVAIIGGGIIGVMSALELAERGIPCAIFEKGEIACEQSSRNWGWCRQMGRDPREIPLIIEALKAWRGMNTRVGAETGYRQCGILYLAETEDDKDARADWLTHARDYGLSSRFITGAEAESLLPGASIPWTAALYTPDDGRAEPQLAAPAMAEAARRKGAKIFTRCAVRGIETTAGRVSGIVTEKGAVACDTVIVAGGAWTRRFLGNAGVPFPQLSVVNSVMRTEPLDTGLETTFSGVKFAVRKRLDGGYSIAHRHFSVADIVPDSFPLFFDFLPALMLDRKGLKLRLGQRFIDEARLARRWALDQVSPFEHVRVLDPAPVDWVLDEAETALKRVFPAFQNMKIAERWAGCIDATPDAVPVISSVPQKPGLIIASGFSGHGFGISPGAGKLAADLATGAPPVVDPTPFRYTRFFDGSKPRPLTGL